jgi:hypothetical protein
VNKPRHGWRLVSVVAGFLLQAATAAGQLVSSTTGAINGRITDSTGAVLPGVTIVASSDAVIGNGGTRTFVTGVDGRYRFPALPPGEYTLLFTLLGFTAVQREAVHVGLSFSATVDVELVVAPVQQSVTVERRTPINDAESVARNTSFDVRQLGNLPGSRSLFAIVTATPAVQVGHVEVGGGSGEAGIPYAAYGARGGTRPTVEGVNVAGLSPVGFPLDYGSFEEVTVGTAAHSPEWPLPGVQVQFITKSGGNRYRGTVYADYERRDWQSFNIDLDQIVRGADGGSGRDARDANRARSYRDINADAGGYLKRDTLWWYSSVRNQDMSSAQINLPREGRRIRLANYTGKGTFKIAPSSTLVVFATAARNQQPFLVTSFTAASTAAVSPAKDSTATLLTSGIIWKAEWNAALKNRLFLELRAGEFRPDRSETPNGASPRFEDAITSVLSGGNRDWQMTRRSSQTSGSVSYFKDGPRGSHHLKAGGQWFHITQAEIWRRAYPGDVLHVLRDGAPSEVYLFQAPSASKDGLMTLGVYAGDTWRIRRGLTLSPGLRLDRYRVFFPAQTHPAGRFTPVAQSFAAVHNVGDWNVVAPRIGVVFAPASAGGMLFKGSYGTYSQGPTTESGRNSNPNATAWWRRYSWSDQDRSGEWEPGEEGVLIENRGGIELESLDPDLRLTGLKEAAFSVEGELSGSVGLRTGVVWRGERQHQQRQSATRQFEDFTVPVTIRDPGPDGIVGTTDDAASIRGYDVRPELASVPQVNVVRNVPRSDSDYLTWELTAIKPLGGRWSLVAGFAHTWYRDQANGYAGQIVRANSYPLTPNDLINAGRDGRYEFTMWSAKIYGTYEGPWRLRVTPYLRHQSGQPFGRTFSTALNYGRNIRILAEPIGTRRMDNITILDLRIEKGVTLPGGRRGAGFVDVFNLLNANPAETASWISGPSFLRPLNIVAPRIVRVGAKLQW